MHIYRDIISKEVNIDHISDSELSSIFDDIGRKIVYEYLLLDKDFTYHKFMKIFKAYVVLMDDKKGKIEKF